MKTLSDLIPLQDGDPRGPLRVGGLAVDSRRVRPGDLFVALTGAHQDGHSHAASAVAAGAVAVLSERPLTIPVPVVCVPSTAQALSNLAARFYEFPARSLDVVGVTGTNGKTTVTYLLEEIWRAEGRPGGVMGTIEYRWPGHVENAVNTTPHALDVQRILSQMRSAGVSRVAMEVSSHALELGRVSDVDFAVGVFTNITQDHLDFHGTQERYFNAKAKLFESLSRSSRPSVRAVVNRDDPRAPALMDRISAPLWTYGLHGPVDIRAEGVVMSPGGTTLVVHTPLGQGRMNLPLVGTYNVSNALAALGGSLALGTPLSTALAGLQNARGVPGRLERVTEFPPGDPRSSGKPFSVFVDFAHTEDALKNVMTAVRPLTRGRLIVLFGCGGDRDRTKRPKMGEIAARLADHVVVTSDNPRSEDPARIADDVAEGVRRVPSASHEVIVDRRAAIRQAFARARPGDVVLLAGKGHETYQIFKDHQETFDDRAVARDLLAQGPIP